MDALILFEACLSGHLTHVPRRPHDRERPHLIKSGNIFIYEEHSSGIKRWTDGVPWSPSRILGNFLIYRELDKPFQPGEKKRAMKRNKVDGGVSKPTPSPRTSTLANIGSGALVSPTTATPSTENGTDETDIDRPYIGSLVDSYQFKDDGLVKKTISVQHKGIQHHLVSYYNLSDIREKNLTSVSQSPQLIGITPRTALIMAGNFRSPIDDAEFGVLDQRGYNPVNSAMEYMPVDSMPPRSLSLPSTQPYGHPQGWGGTAHYAHSSSYALPQPLQPSTAPYTQQMVQYNYESGYGSARSSNYNVMSHTTRRNSVVHSTSNTPQLGYSNGTSGLLANGGGLAAHGLTSSPYLNTGLFSAPAASVAGTSANPSSGYDAVSTLRQNNNMNSSLPHSAAEYHDQLAHSYDHSIGRLALNEFGDSLQDSTPSNFGRTSTHNTPTNMPMSLGHSEIPAADQQWDRAMPSQMHKQEGPEW